MPKCHRCSTDNPSGFRFCGACGAPLAGGEERLQSRKLVTALFCDVAGSTALGDELDPEALRSVLGRYFEDISATIERHGGTVEKYAGDAVLAVFGTPVAHEDDALRAVRAAVEIRNRLPSVAERVGVPLRFRTGLNTGLVLADDGAFVAMGDAMNVAARLEQAAQPGEILLGQETLELVRDAVEVESVGPLDLKGKAQPVSAFRLLAVDPIAPGRARRTDAPLIDHDRELQSLRDTWESVVHKAGCELVTLLGTAGVGKSRLLAEFIDEVGGAATVLGGRCLHYGDGITFWPIIQALSAVGDRARPVIERLEGSGAATREELFWEVQTLLESLARERPLILHVDDLQWAEAMLLDLLDHVVELSHGAPILLVCVARPELLDEAAEWTRDGPRAKTVSVEPLAEADCEELLGALDDTLEPDVRARVIAASDGNPLFLQELVELAREVGTVVIPQTIQALLTARLEALVVTERELLERASVEGYVFHRSAIEALSGATDAPRLRSDLTELVHKDLIRPHPAEAAGDEAFRFRHLLIRDAAYARLPKAARADLHERFAQWLVERLSKAPDLDEIAGWHLEQAVVYRRELSLPVDPALAREGARRLHSGGRRAGERSDFGAARNLLERAHSLAPEDATIAADLAERLIEAGELPRADELLGVAETRGGEEAPVVLCRLEWGLEARPADATQLVESRLPEILTALERARDERGLARAHWLAFIAQWNACQATAAAEQARLTATHARAFGDMGLASRALGWYVATLIYGPAAANTILGALDVIEREQLGPYLTGCLELGHGEVERLGGHFDRARARVGAAREVFESLGMHSMVGRCAEAHAGIELSAGNPAAAVRVLRQSDAILERYDSRAARSTTLATLADASERAGELDQARVALDAAEELGGPEDATNFITAHMVRSRIALRLGDAEGARSFAETAVAIAEQTDFLAQRAQATLTLATVLSAQGRQAQALDQARIALDLFGRKGDGPGSAAARALIRTC
jgi:class 3 adenylate cyclase/tetratricopeptide (TPR) repeat protein